MVKYFGVVAAALALSACTGVTEESSSAGVDSSATAVSSAAAVSSIVPNSEPTQSSMPAVSSSEAAVSSLIPVSSSSEAPSSVVPASSSGTTSSAAPNFDFALGKQLYAEHCIACHGSVGQGGDTFNIPIDNPDFDALMVVVNGGALGASPNAGRMPSLSAQGKDYMPEDCTDDCAYQVSGYISSGYPGADDDGTLTNEIGTAGCSTDEGAPGTRAIRLLTRHEFENSLNDIFGFNLDLTTNFPPEGRDHGFTNNADIAQVTAIHLDNYYVAASRVTAEVMQNLNSGPIRETLNCSANYHCIRTFVEKFGAKLFRRPLQGHEIDQYMTYFMALRPAGQDDNYFNHSDRFREAIGAGLPTLIMSQNFLYRKELGQKDGNVYRLDDYEMAALIAYTFTGTTPDDELLQAARNQQVRTKQQFKEHAERLLATERGKAQMAHFAVEWWDAGLELIGSKNNDFYKGYDAQVIRSMVGEMKEFFKHVVFESTGKFEELYTPGYAMLDRTLSEFYGIGNVQTDAFTKVVNEERGGILSLGGILASKASTEESSPVKRGVFVREQLFCDPLPPLPRDVNIPNPDLDPTKPMRERFEEHSANPACWTCHKYFDDIGFAMEIYDASGKFRQQEIMWDWETITEISRLDILTDGKVINVDGDDTHFFDDLAGLSEIMANAESTKSCMTTQYYRYVMGYSLTDADQCAIKNLNKKFAESEFDIKTMLLGITQLDSFSVRK